MNAIEKLQHAWADICTQNKPGEIEVAGVILSQIIGFIIPATIYLLIDIAAPSFSQRHKLQSTRRQPTAAQIWHCIKISMLNQVWVAAAHALIVYLVMGVNHSILIMDPQLPSFTTILSDFAFGMVAREISFYYIHRALHHPRLYGHIHKMHHRYTAPISFAAEYAHPVEHILANVLPVVAPLALKGTHVLSALAFSVFELWEAAADHSGYDFLKLPPAKIHDLHHEKFRVNYGTVGVMDWIHGTDVVGWDRPKNMERKAQ